MEIQIAEFGLERREHVAALSATVGRDPRNTVVLQTEAVSAFHLQLRATSAGLQARDLGSRNGSALRQPGSRTLRALRPHESVAVGDGDELLLGGRDAPVVLRVRRSAGAVEVGGETVQLSRPVVSASTEALDAPAWATLLGIGRDLLGAETEEQIVDRALAGLLGLLPRASHASVALFDTAPAARRSTLARVWQRTRAAGRTHPLQGDALSGSVLRRALLERMLDDRVGLLLSDVPRQTPGAASVLALELRTAACAPLWVGEEVLGVVQADTRGADNAPLQAADLERLLVLSAPLALALRNGRRMRRLHHEHGRLSAENATLRQRLGPRPLPRLIGASPPLQRLREEITRFGPSDLPVLLQGETGTGKDLVAELLHLSSGRATRPYVAVNMATLSPELAKAELFGWVRGAFTGATGDHAGLFEQAHGGTLFLDELAELPLAAQATLLRVLQTGELQRVGDTRTRQVDVRVLAATNRDLEEAVRTGAFRQDLYFRINTVTLHLPPLRDRGGDVLLLAEHLTARISARLKRQPPSLGADAQSLLLDYAWPGNVRELENELQRAVVLTDPGDPLTGAALSPRCRALSVHAEGALRTWSEAGLPLKEAAAAFEREYVRHALGAHAGNITHTAGALGLTRYGLQKILSRHGLRD